MVYVTFQQPINMYDYRSVVTFGGWNEDLMIVVSQLIESAPHHYEHRTDKLLFLLPKHKVNMSCDSLKKQVDIFSELSVEMYVEAFH